MIFENQSEDFVDGYECGIIKKMLELGYEVSTAIHNSNLRQIKTLLNFHNYDYEIKHYDQCWSLLNGKPINKIGARAPLN